MNEQLKEIFYRFEDLIQEKSVLVGVAPTSMVGVQLQLEPYRDGAEEKYKCNIVVELTDEEADDEDIFESISDTVSDFLRENDLNEELESVGVDPELLDWFPVRYSFVGEKSSKAKRASDNTKTKKLDIIFKKYESILQLDDSLSDYDIDAAEDIKISYEYYDDGGDQKLKCIIYVNQYKLNMLDEDDLESVADTVSDLFRENGIESDLSAAGVDPDKFDWFQIIAAQEIESRVDAKVEKTQIKDIEDVLRKYNDNSSVYIGVKVPEKKLNSAIKTYVANIDPSKILVFVDTTLFGSGKEGFIVTDKNIYTNPAQGKPHSFTLNEFKDAYLKSENFGYVYIGQERVIAAPSTLRKFVEDLVDFLKRSES